MSPRMQTAFHAGTCLLCGQGLLCFALSADGEMMLSCDECEAARTSPADLGTEETLLDSHGPIRWATREEIDARGWASHVVGEYGYHVNKFGESISAAKAEAEERKRLNREQPREQ